MRTFDLVKITSKIDPENITYQALTDKEFDNLVNLESDYSYLDVKYHFNVEYLGEVQIPSL